VRQHFTDEIGKASLDRAEGKLSADEGDDDNSEAQLLADETKHVKIVLGVKNNFIDNVTVGDSQWDMPLFTWVFEKKDDYLTSVKQLLDTITAIAEIDDRYEVWDRLRSIPNSRSATSTALFSAGPEDTPIVAVTFDPHNTPPDDIHSELNRVGELLSNCKTRKERIRALKMLKVKGGTVIRTTHGINQILMQGLIQKSES
jgi:hypothetical protein